MAREDVGVVHSDHSSVGLATPARTGRAWVSQAAASGTELAVGDADVRVHVPGSPDRAGAARVAASFDRVVWQRLDICDGEVSATVVGVRRRRPVELRVSAAAALGLMESGIPTVGRVVEA